MPQDAINLNQKSRSHRFGWSLRLSHELQLLPPSLLRLRNSGGTRTQLSPPTLVTALEGQRDPNSVETFRGARQNEIDERLQGVQQEVTRLTSDLRGEEGR